jgi:alkylation response protein AidB-like acyl-CoA dehydrogenase
MDFRPTEEQDLLRRTVREFAESEMRPHVMEWDEAQHFPMELLPRLGELGLMGIQFPEQYGGAAMSAVDYCICIEELARVCPAIALSVAAHNGLCTAHIGMFGSDAQKEKYLEPFMNGDIRFSISISEPQAGSDAASTRTRAIPDGEDFLLRGQKLWCSGAAAKNVVIAMLVRSDPSAQKHQGLSVFLVPNDSPGLDIRRLPTMARRATGTTEIFVDDARVTRDQLLGGLGQGWTIITDHLELERVAVSAGYVGNAQQAVDDALRYAHERIQFDRPIFEFQVIRHMLADMQTKVDAARLLVYRAADLAARGIACSREVSMGKLFASETLQEVTRCGMQILGGHGMLPESDMERYFREGMQSTIGGGTSQIQRTIIAKSMRVE